MFGCIANRKTSVTEKQRRLAEKAIQEVVSDHTDHYEGKLIVCLFILYSGFCDISTTNFLCFIGVLMWLFLDSHPIDKN